LSATRADGEDASKSLALLDKNGNAKPTDHTPCLRDTARAFSLYDQCKVRCGLSP
jgi:hypothetical protein